MKLLNIVASAAFCVTLCASCEGFLDRFPYDQTSASVAFGSAAKAEAVLAGAYSNISYDYNDNTRLNWDAFAGILDESAASGVSGDYLYLSGGIQINANLFLEWWKRFYEGVNRANDVIEHIDAVPDMDAATKACRKAEAKFLRAFHYYRLNCLWKGVPIYLKNLGTTEYTKGRSTEDEVWQTVIDDLTDALACESLPDRAIGRASKGACYFLRGKAYMWKKDWARAEADFKAITTLGYALPAGVSYAELFTLAQEKSDEMIFSWGAENMSGCGNVFSRTYGNWDTAGNGNNTFYVNTDFVDTYECADGKPFSWDDFLPGYSTMTPAQRAVFFCRDGLTASEKNTLASAGADMSKYLESGNEARIKAAYAARDPRLDATVITPYSEYVGGFYGEELTYVFRYPYRSDETGTGNDIRTRREKKMLYCPRKFVVVGRECTDVTFNPVDVPIFRYADALLLLAEAVNEKSASGYTEAMGYVNQVRARAGVAALGSNTYTAVASQAEMRERIRREKRWELALEEVLFTEELRWGTWQQTRFSTGAQSGTPAGLKELWGTNLNTYSYGGDYYLQWPIPSTEQQKNTNLVQSPEWR